MVVGLLGNKSPDLNRFTLVTPKSENDVRLQVTLGNQNPMGLPVGAVRFKNHDIDMRMLVSKPVLRILFLLVTGFLTYVKIRQNEFGIMSERKKRQLIRDGA